MSITLANSSRIVLALVAALSTSACAAPQRAALPQLQQRAVFDLGCPPQQLALYHIDARTKAVAGCGRQLVYLERCDSGAGDVCSWELDSPSAAQGFWASQPNRALGQSARAQWALQPGENRTMPTKLFEPGQEPRVRPTPSGPATRQRTIRTDLYTRGGQPLKAQPAKRDIPTDLFPETAKRKADDERPAAPGATDPPAPAAPPEAPPPMPLTPYDAR
jgi:hypothetical protein